LNKILSARPAFDDDHFTYRTPRWVEHTYRGLFLSAAALLAYAALSMNEASSVLNVLLWLASGICVLMVIRPRPESASIHFVCDHGGLYFPSSRAKSIAAPTADVPWLHVPWHNVSNARIQLLLDETANTKGVAFSIFASASEEREFLAPHSMRIGWGGPVSGSGKQCVVGFSDFFHRHQDVISNFERFQTSIPVARVQRIETTLENGLAREI